MNQSTEQLLSLARLSLRAFLDTSSLDDEDVMASDCLEEFEYIEWQPNPQLGHAEQQRWAELHQKGSKKMMSKPELKEFFTLTNPEDNYHTCYYRDLSSKLINVAGDHLAQKAQGATSQAQALTQGPMVDWRIYDNELNQEPTPESYKKQYTVEMQFANQIALEIMQSDGEPALGMLIEINHGTPAVHIDLEGGDTLLHIHKGQGGLVLTPDNCRKDFESAAIDELSYNAPNSLLLKA
ncbi:hypothetical protein [Shewanella colwelliana]|uniref:hypothetical protein n=1 Tax=Shewanella colwelliana TaxID=23 RepID=UPI0022AEF567|nr:hypothetical protein [Shewanella colwelliana]MCZ4337658.1 hypothetical protein [Shewanella colwelliana]